MADTQIVNMRYHWNGTIDDDPARHAERIINSYLDSSKPGFRRVAERINWVKNTGAEFFWEADGNRHTLKAKMTVAKSVELALLFD